MSTDRASFDETAHESEHAGSDPEHAGDASDLAAEEQIFAAEHAAEATDVDELEAGEQL